MTEEPTIDRRTLGSDERTTILHRWNATESRMPEGTALDLFQQHAAQAPDALAICSNDEQISYGELNARATRLAAELQNVGVRPGSVVGICARRSVSLVVGILAIWKAGGAYVPLDPEYPAKRLDHMLEDSGATALVGQEPVTESLADGVPVLDPASDGPVEGRSLEAGGTKAGLESLAYVIYTSGSTGTPKGVCVQHRSLTNVLTGIRAQLGAGREERWLALTSPSFDISVLELFSPLISGATTVIAPQHAMWNVAALRAFVQEHRVTHIQATPTGWQVLVAGGFDDSSVVALVGGEALSRPLAQALRQRVGRLINVYGPTETTVWSTAFEIDDAADEVPIGRPIANTRVYVLDDNLVPVPVGVPGELFIGGAGVARGYLRRPGLTAERFLPDPFGNPGDRLYRTGDRVRWGADGALRFIGRVDNQVKLHGHRIELGELEARLVEHTAVNHAVAAIRDGANGEPMLVAYLVGTDIPDEASLAEFASEWLPPHMVPHTFVILDRLPVTPAGKVDRSALPRPTLLAADPDHDQGITSRSVI